MTEHKPVKMFANITTFDSFHISVYSILTMCLPYPTHNLKEFLWIQRIFLFK